MTQARKPAGSPGATGGQYDHDSTTGTGDLPGFDRALSPDPAVRDDMALTDGLPRPVALRLSVDPDPGVRADLAATSQDPMVLANMASDPAVPVREAVASNLAAPRGTRGLLARDPDPRVRAAWAGTTDDRDRLDRLVGCEQVTFVRCDAAANPLAGRRTLDRLAGDPNPRVRLEAAANPSTRPDTLAILTGDTDRRVRGSAASNLSLTDPDALQALSRDGSPSVRAALLRRPVPDDIMSRLARDKDETVRTLAAQVKRTGRPV